MTKHIKEDRPIEGVQYALTGKKNDKCIANGNSWAESRVNKAQEKYENEILTLIDNRDDYTWSDIQGMVTAIVKKIAYDESLLDFETRLTRSKANDLQ